MRLRRTILAARRGVSPALMTILLLGGSQAVAQTSEDRTPETALTIAPAPPPAEGAALVPGASATVRMAPIRTPEDGPAPAETETGSGVFDAPDQPGVRMMAPIPDKEAAPPAKSAPAGRAAVAATGKRRGFSGPTFL